MLSAAQPREEKQKRSHIISCTTHKMITNVVLLSHICRLFSRPSTDANTFPQRTLNGNKLDLYGLYRSVSFTSRVCFGFFVSPPTPPTRNVAQTSLSLIASVLAKPPRTCSHRLPVRHFFFLIKQSLPSPPPPPPSPLPPPPPPGHHPRWIPHKRAGSVWRCSSSQLDPRYLSRALQLF